MIMKKTQRLISKLILLTSGIFTLVSCGDNDRVSKIVFDENYQEVWKAGEIDFSKLFFEVTHENGIIEKVPVDISMINEKDLYKFYEVGDWKVKINYSETSYAIVDFTIVENEFSDDLILKSEIIAYDGASHGLKLQGPLPEGTNVYFPYGNSFSLYSQNPYQVKCIVSKEGYKTKELNGTLTITKSDYDKAILDAIEFEDAEFVYDGLEKKIVASNVPQDCTIEYYIGKNQGNTRINVGEYEIIGVLTCSNSNYNEIPNISATLKIKPAPYDMSEVKFKSKVVPYEKGKTHSIVLDESSILPNGVKVTYANNEHEDAGEYEAVAYFEGDSNHQPINPMKATLTISKKDIDLSGIKVTGAQTIYYSGEKREFEVEVPQGIKAIRKYYDQKGFELSECPVNVGVYTVNVSFGLEDGLEDYNFNLLNVPKVNGVLYIQKKVIDLTPYNFLTQTYTYDKAVHDFDVESVIVDGETVRTKLPDEVIVEKTYVFNDQELVLEKPKEVGVYKVNFDVKLKDGLLESNFDIRGIPTESGRLIINKNVIDLIDIQPADQTYVYNGEVQEYVLEGIPEDSVIANIVYHDSKGVEITPDKVKDVGDYRIHVYFSLNEEAGFDAAHYELANAKVRQPFLHIVKCRIDFSDVVPLDDIVAEASVSGFLFTGNYIKNFKNVSNYVKIVVSYSKKDGANFVPLPLGELPCEAGKYQAKVGFQLKDGLNPNNYDLYRMSEYIVNLTLE